jgi:hypothetical protein
MISNAVFAEMINAPVRRFRGRVEIYEGSTLALMCGCHDSLKEFTVERTGEGKFFGYGVCQRLNVKLRDVGRNINITTANTLEVEFGVGANYIYPFPAFYVTEVNRDEITNELSVTAYDALHKAAKITVGELGLKETGYTILEFVEACGVALGLPVNANGLEAFNTAYAPSANFEGTETIREALDAVAEATQTIYFINWDWVLTFKRLDNNSPVDLVIDKSKQLSLDSGENRRLAKIVHATELGDNVSAAATFTGSTQYVRNNPFWEMREDIDTLLTNALDAVGGLTINKFSCTWRGNFLLEIGDAIALVDKDNAEIRSYLLNDSLTFNGSLQQETAWEFSADDTETEANPVALGDVLRQTYARVDKANKEIELLASDVSQEKEKVASLQVTAESVEATVSSLEKKTDDAIGSISESVEAVAKEVSAKMSAEDVQIRIDQSLENGVDKVVTSTGFTFNETGLTVSKTGSEMTTTITEDGMVVYRDNTGVLTANNEGVDAVNLHASTYLIVGGKSRFENFGNGRTGCFWIGG